MDAVISGQARTALIIDNDNFLSFDLETPNLLMPRFESDLPYLFGQANDLRFIQTNNKKDIFLELQKDYYKTCALDLALIFLDKDIQETKRAVGEALEKLLQETNLDEYLDSVFYAQPLPKSVDAKRALSLSMFSFPILHDWLSMLVEKQDAIFQVRRIWEAVEVDILDYQETRKNYERVLVEEGIFRELVFHYYYKEEIYFDSFKQSINDSIGSLPNYQIIFQEFFNRFNRSLLDRSYQVRICNKKSENAELVPLFLTDKIFFWNSVLSKFNLNAQAELQKNSSEHRVIKVKKQIDSLPDKSQKQKIAKTRKLVLSLRKDKIINPKKKETAKPTHKPKSILERIAVGDKTAVEECLKSYGGLIWSLAHRLTTSNADAEDAVQEIFVDIWKNAARFDSEQASETTFIALIARRRLIDRLRYAKRKITTDHLEDVTSDLQDRTDEDVIIQTEAKDAARAIQQLRPEQRQVLQLSIVQGMSNQEISEVTGISPQTVRTHAQRGILQIRKILGIKQPVDKSTAS